MRQHAIGLGNRLAIFQNKLVDAITRNHDVDLLLPGQKPCAYFVIISAQDSACRFLSSLFFSLALPRLPDYARLKGENGRLPVLVNFCLDEYCNIGYMEGIALFQGRKPALLYKLAPEELPGYGTLESCRVADYTPEWKMREEQEKAQTAKKVAPPDVPGQEPPAPPKQPTPEDEPDPSQDLEYQLINRNKGLGMVELDADSVVGGDDEEEESPPGR